MKKYQKRHRIIATFFLLIFFPTLIPNNLFAYNNGPNSFEAASFEPVDAADMVNLVTGDMSYVLPLLNVPSPEGGYPLALSYHAGIAMDQEASWVGLGWSLNPGAINRNINGYADDIDQGDDYSIMYDQGGELNYYNVGIGGNINGINFGVGAYWGSNKTFGGSVTLGYGPVSITAEDGSLGTNIGIGAGYASGEYTMSNNSTGAALESIMPNPTSRNNGTGLSKSSTSFGENGYDIQFSNKNYSIGYLGFYASYSHTKIKYSLFKEKLSSYNGVLYSNVNPDYKNAINYDTNKLAIYDEGVTNIENVLNSSKNYLCDNVLLPNYDNYKVQAQGLSGNISPTFTEEAQLRHENITSDLFNVYRTDNGIESGYYDSNINYHSTYNTLDTDLKLNNKIFFDFENTNSSFLRIDRTTISTTQQNDWIQTVLAAKTNKSNNFSEITSNDNVPLKNNHRKRAGKHIEAFTNEQIRSGNAKLINGFIEALNLNRNQLEVYKPESIGGYQITDVDGKTYHYSLPVINYEIWYKNFSNKDNEDSKFLERQLNTPYATDWLLTAVTGPDYVDKNDNGKVDKEDYGYWVEFDYGKWSDGYIWNSSSGKNNIVKGSGTEADNYEYYKGRKQIYYLDAVRTRTHTAYFIKSVRQDATADYLTKFNTYSTNGTATFNSTTNPKTVSSALTGFDLDNKLKYKNIPPFPVNNSNWKFYMNGYQRIHTYLHFPTHYSLKLDKIVLVKNNSLILEKNKGSQTLTAKGYLYRNRSFEVTKAVNQKLDYSNHEDMNEFKGVYYTNTDLSLKEIAIHQSKNILDISDLYGIDVDSKAEKIINLQHNYSLIPESFHSEASNKGKLTLNSVQFLGHKGVSYIPKFQFKYNNTSFPYSLNDQDAWGYNKNAPHTWSLSEIITPMGSKITINYEADDYSIIATSASSYGKGGGIRVKQINTFENENLVSRSNYYYNKTGTDKDVSSANYKSSGVISYVPSDNLKLPYISELPPPIVMYSNVSVEQTAGNNELFSRTEYNFETLPEYTDETSSVYNLGKYFVVEKIQNETQNLGLSLNFTKYNIKNRLSYLGRLLSIKNYNSKNQLHYFLKNEYATPADIQDELGTKQESFISKSYIKEPDPASAVYNPNVTYVAYGSYFVNYGNVNSISKIWYPSQLTKTTITQGGYTNSTTYNKFDFLTGNVTESTSTTSDGKSYKTKIVPAYSKYPEMGSKADNINNKNMLSQTAVNYSYIKDNGTWKETGVGITTWSNVWAYEDIAGTNVPATTLNEKIWRKHKTFVWNGTKDANGIFTGYDAVNGSGDDNFIWNLPTSVGMNVIQPSQWKQISEVTCYNHYSIPLEIKDINNNFASTKMGDNDTKVMVSGNAGYNEMFYTGGEYSVLNGSTSWLEPGISYSSTAYRSENYPHTGKNSIAVNSSSQFGVLMKSGQHRAGKYKVSVWLSIWNSYMARLKVNNDILPFTESYDAGSWVLKTAYVDVPLGDCSIFITSSGATLYFDDLMIRPVSSSITGYVYNEWDELTAIIGNNGLGTKFEYDAAGRLTKTYKEVISKPSPDGLSGGFKLVKENKINNKYFQQAN
ncbi:RHS repeat domain-containing protein [Flavobacterium ajazii]|uniref:RHS repeat domain-containing protein n=1 Tax=Flavobacterium ajazii TaxID=2692318 RepID=UPI0013CF7D1C|nr:RHS repeat domain-containing protein [Flavobacterium ajazii]